MVDHHAVLTASVWLLHNLSQSILETFPQYITHGVKDLKAPVSSGALYLGSDMQGQYSIFPLLCVVRGI